MKGLGGLQRCRLEAADVLLVHTKRSLWGWLIRAGTRCYWNHALLVCRTGDTDEGYRSTLVVDAKSDGTIVIRPVRGYLDNPGKYDIAVKRLQAGLPEAAGLRLRSHICDVAVNEVGVEVGLPLAGSFDRIIRQFTLILRFIRRKMGRAARQPVLSWSARPADVKAFTCGGFVQWCYYQAARRMVAEGSGDGSLFDAVLLGPGARARPTPFELLTTTPAVLTESAGLSWRYVIRDGVIEEVGGLADSPACPANA